MRRAHQPFWWRPFLASFQQGASDGVRPDPLSSVSPWELVQKTHGRDTWGPAATEDSGDREVGRQIRPDPGKTQKRLQLILDEPPLPRLGEGPDRLLQEGGADCAAKGPHHPPSLRLLTPVTPSNPGKDGLAKIHELAAQRCKP